MYEDKVSFKQEFEQAKEYWRSKFSDEINDVDLPSDFERSLAFKRSELPIEFKRELSEKIISLSKGQDILLFVVLLSALDVLIFKYTNKYDISTGAPVYIDDDSLDNKKGLIIFRDFLDSRMSFKDLLINVKQTVIEGYENQHYVVEDILDVLGVKIPETLSRVILLLDNIHGKEIIEDILNSPANDLTFLASKNHDTISGMLEYNEKLLKRETVSDLARQYLHILEQGSANINIKIDDIEILSKAEKQRMLYEFNNTETEFPFAKRIHQLFEEQVRKTPENTAINFTIDLSSIYETLKSEKTNAEEFQKLEECCFQKAPHIFQMELSLDRGEQDFILLKTPQHNNIVVNANLLRLLECFDGERNLESVFSSIKENNLVFIAHTISMDDILEISYGLVQKTEIFSSNELEQFIALIRLIYRNNLIVLTDLKSKHLPLELQTIQLTEGNKPFEFKDTMRDILFHHRKTSKADVLLLGDTAGMASTGILHLGSYLVRNGFKVKCQYFDCSRHHEALRENIFSLLESVQPKIVGVSMKWFPHMARVFEICRIIKEFSPELKVVLGGNSASYYWKEVIGNENVDCIIRGDGELPLLKVCQGIDEKDIPNCVYKKDGEIIENPITYVLDETSSSEIYLSHLDEIMLSDYSSIFGTFYIPTQRGCAMPCFYCAGCKQGQKQTFNRTRSYRREVKEVRKDIIEAKKYTSIYCFELEAPNPLLFDYTKKILEDIDLSEHYCIFSSDYVPSAEVIKLVNETFKYVYWNYDIASLSQRHREQLFSLNLIKPSPKDEEIIASFDEFEKYENCEVKLNTIVGLPFYYPEDLEASEKLIEKILSDYTCVSELHWGRLHAQPGAPIVEDVEKHDMYSYASTYEDYLKYSELNLKNELYPTIENLNYPYIYYNKDDLNQEVTRFYAETTRKLKEYLERKQKKLIINRELSYGELNERANRLARTLRTRGVERDSIVGLMFDSSPGVAVAMLAVLKAGAAYLPIDPENPGERKKYIIENSNTQVCLIQGALYENNQDVVHSIPGESLIIIDNDTKSSGDSSNLNIDGGSDDLAYVVYTSGTTGVPKGILVPHRGIANYSNWRILTYQLNDQDVTLQILSYSFDGYCSNFYSTLLSGGTLCIIPDAKRLDFGHIAEIIKQKNVTNMSLVPGAYDALLGSSKWGDFGSLRFVVLAGEKCGVKIIKESQDKAPGVLLINEYGPTETSVTATSHTGINEFNARIIGKPISNVRTYIFDSSMHPVPIKVSGELCVAGVGVGRGYLNNPELTHQKFLLNPQIKGERLYRTGDLVRRCPSGEIEFLGRIDHQVKIRGNRIELAEIEKKLLTHELIKNAVVLVRENEQGYGDLYAYLEPHKKGEVELNVSLLRKHLLEELPEYMIPAYFVQIGEIPLTTNGKVDRKALEAYNTNLGTAAEYVAPTNKMESIVADIWKEVLKLEKVSVNDLFFELGGNSLNIIQASGKLKETLGVDISVVTLFEYPTVRAISEYLSSEKDAVSISEPDRTEAIERGKQDKLKRLQKRREVVNEKS
jgi:amino acid adenylation domain-containing protein